MEHSYETCVAKVHIENLSGWQNKQNGSLQRLETAVADMRVESGKAHVAAVDAAKSAAVSCTTAENLAKDVRGNLSKLFWSVAGLGSATLAALILQIVKGWG